MKTGTHTTADNRVDQTDRSPLLIESFLVDDSGFLLSTWQVNVPANSSSPGLSWPVGLPTVVRGCESQYAIENCGTLLLRKPEYYRYDDDTIIGDTSENIITRARSSRIERTSTIDELDLDKRRDDEFNRGSSLIGSKRRITTNSSSTTRKHRTTRSTRTTETHGRNGWILCASLEPSTPEEWERWHSSLSDSYDHTTTIRSPRIFARALAAMVADQIGPLGDQEAKLTHQPSGAVTHHPSQKVFHGPVTYVDDPYSYVTEATETADRMLRAAFFKSKKHQHQREYRFLVWANEEPTEMTVQLTASQEMLRSLARPVRDDRTSAH